MHVKDPQIGEHTSSCILNVRLYLVYLKGIV